MVRRAGRGIAPSSAPSTGELAENAECVEARRILLAQAEDLNLPPNFLDELIDELGGTAAVAEMTGRRARVVRVAAPRGKGDSDDSGDDVRLGARASGTTFRFESRAEPRAAAGGAAAGSNANDGGGVGGKHREKAAVNRRDNLVAVIMTRRLGICRVPRAGNQRRRASDRLPWADKAIQQLGRTPIIRPAVW